LIFYSQRYFSRATTKSAVSPSSWCQLVAVAWIEHGLTDVGKIQDPSGESFESNGETAMRRHSEVEHPEMAFEIRGFQPSFS
jgi:hypothetical protein